jgi:hypothetical protein
MATRSRGWGATARHEIDALVRAAERPPVIGEDEIVRLYQQERGSGAISEWVTRERQEQALTRYREKRRSR